MNIELGIRAGWKARIPTIAPIRGLGRRIEDTAAVAAFLAMAILPVLELILRALLGVGLPGTTGYIQNLTLWVGYLGAMIAAREGRHLSLSTRSLGLPPRFHGMALAGVGAISAIVAAGLLWASFKFVWVERESAQVIAAWLPVWMAEAILPISFAVMTVRFFLRIADRRMQMGALAGIAITGIFSALPYALEPFFVWPAIGVLIVAALFQAPIFIVIGGVTLLLFLAADIPAAALPVSTYRIAVSPLIPTIPLFTLAGYVLAEGGARGRLVRLFRAWFGWLPGGEAVAVTMLCAFFTAFTGASGVAILALGGLMLPVLLKSGYPERFSVGLVTATGSIGLLFPPSIAVILYATMSYVPIPELFLAGLIPGLIMVGAICLFGVWQGIHAHTSRVEFDRREALGASWTAKFDLPIPFIILFGVFGGFATLIEAAAVAVVYVLVVETVIHRELSLPRDVPRITLDCITLVGGVFAILGVAYGLANYFVDAEISSMAAEWVKDHIHSRIAFLLALNVFLLVVGCLLDIFSAIIIIAPLLVPISQNFGIHPAHLGIIFLANLELGYLTPPVGMNLFLAAFRFDRSVIDVSRSALPFLLLLLLVVLLVTYIPELTIVTTSGA